jgi:hypothetical protein
MLVKVLLGLIGCVKSLWGMYERSINQIDGRAECGKTYCE